MCNNIFASKEDACFHIQGLGLRALARAMKFNRELIAHEKKTRGQLKAWGFGPGIPKSDAHQTGFYIQAGLGQLSMLWSEYNTKVDGRGGGGVAQMRSMVKDYLRQAKDSLAKARKTVATGK